MHRKGKSMKYIWLFALFISSGLFADEATKEFELKHTYTKNQIPWFQAGSALNSIKS